MANRKSKDPDGFVKPKRKKELSCDRCSESFDTIDELNHHFRVAHFRCKVFYCAICCTTYKEHHVFQAHLSTCPGRKYKCNFLNFGQIFSEVGLLESHAIMHRTGPVLPPPPPPPPPKPKRGFARLRKGLPKVTVERVRPSLDDAKVKKAVLKRYEKNQLKKR